MLYPVLHRLESLGYIEGRWEVSESGRRRKYYRITPDGRAQLVEEHRQWKAVEETMRDLWSKLGTRTSTNHPAQDRLLPQEG
jgi:PadR family transcriptional regulator PadR